MAARVSNDAATTAGSGPYDQPYLDWSLWETLLWSDQGLAAVNEPQDSLVRVIDVRSMRKLEEINEQFTFWIQANQVAWTFSANLSVLLKLP